MQNQIAQMLTNHLQGQLKNSNPQAFQRYEMMRKSNGNPMEIFNQMTSGYSKEQMQNFMSFAKNFGIPDEVLNQVQNGINPRG